MYTHGCAFYKCKSLLGVGEAQLLSPSLLMMPRMCDQSGGGQRGCSSSESRVRRYSSPGAAASEGFQAVHLRDRPGGKEWTIRCLGKAKPHVFLGGVRSLT